MIRVLLRLSFQLQVLFLLALTNDYDSDEFGKYFLASLMLVSGWRLSGKQSDRKCRANFKQSLSITFCLKLHFVRKFSIRMSH